jgi:hypothetical protein
MKAFNLVVKRNIDNPCIDRNTAKSILSKLGYKTVINNQ